MVELLADHRAGALTVVFATVGMYLVMIALVRLP